MSKFTLAIVFCLCSTFVFSQDVEVKGTFLKDSVKVGEQIQFTLTAISDKEVQILFPSKAYNFYPFELVEKTPFKTTIFDSTKIKDSAIYTLRTFNMDTALVLQLPVFKINEKGDSIMFFHEPSEIQLKRVITNPPKDFKTKVTADYVSIPILTNWPFWTLIAILIGLTLVITLFFTGKPLLRYIAVKRLTKRHQKFLLKFEQQLAELTSNGNSSNPEVLIQQWKDHASYLSKQPLKSYTTKDFKLQFENESLIKSLTEIDGVIYGGKPNEKLQEASTPLIAFSNELFNERIEQIKHGKRVK